MVEDIENIHKSNVLIRLLTFNHHLSHIVSRNAAEDAVQVESLTTLSWKTLTEDLTTSEQG